MGVKISPGVDYAELPPEAEVEFISEERNVKEAILWFGDLQSGANRRATLLPGQETMTDLDPAPSPVAVTLPGAVLYEPDGAVIRAHLVEQLAGRLNATKLDPDIAYLTAGAYTPTPFALQSEKAACPAAGAGYWPGGGQKAGLPAGPGRPDQAAQTARH